MTKVTIVIPAAGASRRMRGRDKLLEPVDGKPVLRGVVERALEVATSVIVTLPKLDHPRADALQGLPVIQVDVADADEGMAASLRAAISYVPEGTHGVMILHADMPDLTISDLSDVIKAFGTSQHEAIVQGMSHDKTPGHPVLFPMDLVAGFSDLTGDTGARSIVQAYRHRLRPVMLPGTHAITDLDTPEAWADWRSHNPDR